MKKTWVPTAISLVAVAAVGGLFAYHAHKSSSQGRSPADESGVINKNPAVSGLTVRSEPQLADQRFEPLPSLGVGTYTEPAAKAGDSKNSGTDR